MIDETVEVLFVYEYLVTLKTVPVEFTGALGNGNEKIIGLGLSDVKKIGPSFTCTKLLRKNIFYVFFVFHGSWFCCSYVNILIFSTKQNQDRFSIW